MNFHPDFSKNGVPGDPVPGSEASEDGWIPIDLDAIRVQGSAEPQIENAAGPALEGDAVRSGPPLLLEAVGRGSKDAPEIEAHGAQDLGPPVAVARLHGWLERLRPSEPGLLSFERPRDRDIEPEPPPPRRVPETDIVHVGRAKSPPDPEKVTNFDQARADAETPDDPPAREPSNAKPPGPGPRRRKRLLGLALLIAITGALQALMRLTQAPATPALTDMLTF